jgi:hypoxanthine phosphoribosyltransferase
MSTISHQGLTFSLLYSREDIAKVVATLSQQINAYYQKILEQDGSLDLVVVCVLKGAFMFYTDLVKEITHPHYNEFIRCRSYHGTSSTG